VDVHLLEFFFSDHCPACPVARRTLQACVSRRSDVVLVEYDVDADVSHANRYGLFATPAVVIDRHRVLYAVTDVAALDAHLDAGAVRS
jgi:hypothetical protein